MTGAETDAAAGTGHKTAWPRIAVISVTFAGIALLLQLVQGVRDVAAPVFLGLNLMIVAYPLQRVLMRWMQRYLAAALTLVAVLVVVFAFFGASGWAVGELLRELPRYNSQFSSLWADTVAALAAIGISQSMIVDQFAALGAGGIASLLSPVVGNVTAVLGTLVTVIMAVFFLAMDSAGFHRRLAMVRAGHPGMSSALISFSQGVRRYWVVTTLFGLIVALLDVLALAIIGVPLMWVWGVLAFLTNYIPNIGFVIGLVPPALLALLDGGPGPALAVVITYSFLNFTVQAIIQPKFAGQSVGVTPTLSFISLLFWYWVLGWLGALLALPATLLLKALLVDADPSARWINALISSNPAPEVPAGMQAAAEAAGPPSSPAAGAPAPDDGPDQGPDQGPDDEPDEERDTGPASSGSSQTGPTGRD
ncbi:AI-2E family transporter [Zhihengliuella alba]|uniref:AI-2E family transporter n=1 Tax=Zhihengliuella alba TaxID=547018 RepID=A0ABP7DIH4_9MICC